MSITILSLFMALVVVPLIAFVISPATSHDQSPIGVRTNLTHVDHLLAERLTKTELLLRAIKRGKHRVKRLNSRKKSIQSTIDDGSGEYLMNFSIGTPTQSPLTAIMDTGSSLIWTQCQPCQACINQSTPIFEPKDSSSYSSLKCSTKQQCKGVPSACSRGYCTYHYEYGDDSYTRGVVATDTFTFEGDVKVPRIVFGCGVVNNGNFDMASGVVGLGPEGFSLISQMNASGFWYCLPTFGSGSTGFLGIGSTPPPGVNANIAATPLIKNPLGTHDYYLSLQGITIGTKCLPINSTTFEIKKDGSGGIVIDTGTTITYLVKTAFDQVSKELTRQLGLKKVDGSDYSLELCFDVTSVDVMRFKFPQLVFHFQNKVNLRLTHENYFSADDRVGCLAMASVGNDDLSILGNFQQQNTLVVHDLVKGTLSFLPNYAMCSGN